MIKLKGIKKTYQGSVHALKGIDLEIDSGEIYGIIGLSGAGKSTLIRLLNRLEVPTEGEVTIDGIDLSKLNAGELRAERKQIGMIFQHFNLLNSKTIFRNIAYPLEISGVSKPEIERRVSEMLKLVDLSEKANAYPTMLSGGQKQRAAIARALVSNPKLLLCDEATSALDPKTTLDILTLLKDINQRFGITIVLITHEMSVIQRICDKVAVIDGGHIVESGAVKSVFQNPEKAITKELIEHLPRHIYTDDLFSAYEGKVVRLHFDEATTSSPIVAEAILKTGLAMNILMSEIDEVSMKGIGSMVIEIPGTLAAQEEAVAYFKAKGIKVEGDLMMEWLELLWEPTLQTLYMVFVSTVVATILGFPLGVILVVTEPGHLMPMPKLNQILGTVVNVLRSFPFIILMIILFPLSRWIVGTTIGTTATIVPLAIGAAPLVGRIVESSLKEVDRGVIEAAKAMGSTHFQIVWKVLIPESLSSLVLGLTLTIISVIGYSAMAGAIGGGGLGDLAIRYGFHRFQTDVLIAAVIIMILLVQVIQAAGNALAKNSTTN